MDAQSSISSIITAYIMGTTPQVYCTNYLWFGNFLTEKVSFHVLCKLVIIMAS